MPFLSPDEFVGGLLSDKIYISGSHAAGSLATLSQADGAAKFVRVEVLKDETVGAWIANEGVPRGFGFVPIAGSHVGTPDQEFASFAGPDFVAVVIDDFGLGMKHRLAA